LPSVEKRQAAVRMADLAKVLIVSPELEAAGRGIHVT